MIGAANYHTANVSGSHATTDRMNAERRRGRAIRVAPRTIVSMRYADAAAAAPGGSGGSSPRGSVRTHSSHTISTSSMISACHT